MWSAPSNNRNWVLFDQLLGYAMVLKNRTVFSVWSVRGYITSVDWRKKKNKKNKVLTLNKYMAMGPSGARCQE
jgi:hypothetical protein